MHRALGIPHPFQLSLAGVSEETPGSESWGQVVCHRAVVPADPTCVGAGSPWFDPRTIGWGHFCAWRGAGHPGYRPGQTRWGLGVARILVEPPGVSTGALTVLPCPRVRSGPALPRLAGRQAGQAQPPGISVPSRASWGPSHNWISGPKGIHLDISKYPPGCGHGLWPSQTPFHGRHTCSHPVLLSGLIGNFIFILQAPSALNCP